MKIRLNGGLSGIIFSKVLMPYELEFRWDLGFGIRDFPNPSEPSRPVPGRPDWGQYPGPGTSANTVFSPSFRSMSLPRACRPTVSVS